MGEIISSRGWRIREEDDDDDGGSVEVCISDTVYRRKAAVTLDSNVSIDAANLILPCVRVAHGRLLHFGRPVWLEVSVSRLAV